ncbi:MAG: glyoxalase family protein [Solirubrobacteraceae bacterium]|nr:glyoxalase family protein [Solirubrobacteraceae bacterium]
MKLEGIHHITAITGDAPRNVDFYTRVLGLRMAAKTVNQDDPTVYHLFYADERARPGAEITFFEYPGASAGRPGPGMVHRIVWRVGGPEAIDFWERRLGAEGVTTQRDGDRLLFEDFEGLGHELAVDDSGDEPLAAEHPEVPAEHALQGFGAVRAYSFKPEHTAAVLEQLLGATAAGDQEWELRGERRGGAYRLDEAPDQRGLQGAGTVHHVAFGTTVAEHPRWFDHIRAAGVQSSPIIDRHYFHSIYFREPGGVLFEIADDGPGFTVDVPLEELGSKVILPPTLEPHRAEIESILTPLPDPRAGWAKAQR